MGYVVKHSTSNVNKTRRKGNVALGVSSEGYDKTSVSGFYTGVPPVEGKHNFVRTAAGGNPNFYSLTDEELINFVNGLGERNLTHKTPSQAGWAGSYSLTDNDTRTFNLTTQQNNAATTSAWRTWYWDVSDYIGSTVAISADVEFVSETNCTWLSMTIGQGNTGQYTTHIAGSDAADRVTVNTKPTTSIRMEWSGSINATGIVGFTQWINNVTTNGANAVIEVSNVQIEANGHVTEFSNPDAIVYNVLEAKNYLNSRSDIIFTDNIKNNNIVTDGLILNLNAKNKSSFLDNEPTINLLEQPYASSLDTRSDIYNNVNKTDLGNGKYEFTNDGTGSTTIRLYCNLSDLTDGETYACSVSYEKFDPGDGSSVTLDWCDVQGVSFPIGTYGEANRISIVQTRSSYNSTYRFFDISLPTNSSIVLFDAQVEQKSSSTPFTSGSRSQNTTWYDLSGNENNATLTSPFDSEYNFNSEYFESRPTEQLNAIDDTDGSVWEVSYSSELTPTSEWTVGGLLRISGSQSSNGTGWFHKTGNGDERGIHIEPIGSNFRVNGSSNWSHLLTNVSAYHHKWTYYTATYKTTGTYGTSTGNLNFYANGKLLGSLTNFTPAADTTSVIRLGRRNGHYKHFLNGDTATYQYYTKELSQSEINQNYYGGPIVTDGLVFATDAGNLVSYESGSTTTYSMTGSYSGSLDNGVTYTDSYGGGFDFDGSNDHITCDDSTKTGLNFGTGDFTLEAWFRPIDNSNSWTGVMVKGGSGSPGYAMTYRAVGSGIDLKMDIDAPDNKHYQSGYLTSGEVYHIVMVYDRDTAGFVYNNGELTHTHTDLANQNQSVDNSSFPLQLGTYDGGQWFMEGNIYAARVYDRALTADEVLQNYNAQKARFI
jgi:hypothetical protein